MGQPSLSDPRLSFSPAVGDVPPRSHSSFLRCLSWLTDRGWADGLLSFLCFDSSFLSLDRESNLLKGLDFFSGDGVVDVDDEVDSTGDKVGPASELFPFELSLSFFCR